MRYALQALALLLLISTRYGYAETPASSYSFGIGPQQSATELAKRWTPFLQYLSNKSGVTLQFKTAKDIPTYQQQMRDGGFDFAYINPYHYTLFHKAAGYTAFAREKDGALTGVIVVKKDAPIQDVSQLNGSTMAFPASTALAATWLPLNHLSEKHVTVTPQYVNSMDSVYRSVAKGMFPAGGGEMRTLSMIDSEIKQQLRVIWSSEALPSFTFAAHPRTPKDIVAKVQMAMDQMEKDPEGAALLKSLSFKGFDPAEDRDYDALRKLNIKPVEAK
jgi:phosphonate transport system substrate-binding protein